MTGIEAASCHSRRTEAHAGCADVVDDRTWQWLPPLFSLYSAVFLGHPTLQYLDVSNTSLTNHGLLFLLLELAHCDPVLSPPGLQCLRQVCLGPPADASPVDAPAQQWLPTVLGAATKLCTNCPALEACVLLCHCHAAADHDGHALAEVCATWLACNEGNTAHTMDVQQQVAVCLRTRCEPVLQCACSCCRAPQEPCEVLVCIPLSWCPGLIHPCRCRPRLQLPLRCSLPGTQHWLICVWLAHERFTLTLCLQARRQC